MSPTRFRRISAAAALALAGSISLNGLVAPAAQAANETVSVWLTTTSDSGGRTVTRGLQQQAATAFSAGASSAAQTIAVNDGTRYQQFTGGGASFTDTAAWLLDSSNALTASARTAVMQKLFDPSAGIGLSFLRNPMGASDLARYGYSFDDLPAGQTDTSLSSFSIAHDLADVLPLTKQAQQLNPTLTTMASPWSAPAWMKDSGTLNGGWLQSQYYGTYAQYFVKYLQAYQAQGVKINFVSVQNEPTCCAGYPSMSWNGSGLDYFTGTNLLPALHAAGLSAKVLALDWNPDSYDSYAAPTVSDAAVRNDSLFGGIAWHGYSGDPAEQTTIHNQYPAVASYDTEHSGGTWVGNQQQQDMLDLVNYGRNWGKSLVKWSLAVDQNMGPHNGGCGTCTGLVTVHNGDSRSGQVDYTVEYYDMGHLTKFVKPGAYRVDSSANSSVPNIAYLNSDGTRALIAYNNTSTAQQVVVNWNGEHFSYNLPTKTSATFTWNSSGSTTAKAGPISGLAGKCIDVRSGATANGTPVQLYTCNGSGAQTWTVGTDGTLRALSKCLDVSAGGTADGTKVQLWDCNGSAAQQWSATAGQLVNPQANKCLDVTGNTSADGTQLQIWTCTGGANQKWTLPS
ncbi:MAG: glucosylceramidase [Frankiales bacterium]|jgi:glucosylceramidase|nr:glucosylceramidase [Frankiales bacterium]